MNSILEAFETFQESNIALKSPLMVPVIKPHTKEEELWQRKQLRRGLAMRAVEHVDKFVQLNQPQYDRSRINNTRT